MKSSAYRYAAGIVPMPGVLINIANPDTGIRIENLQAIVDTGADQTLIPLSILETLDAAPIGEEEVLTFHNEASRLATYRVEVRVRDFDPIVLEVIGCGEVTRSILGRDLLNRYKIVLDGPNQRIELYGQ